MNRKIDMVPYSQYKRIADKFEQRSKENTDLKSKLTLAKAILDAPITKNNLTNAILTLESLPDPEALQRFIVTHVIRSAKSPNQYCRIIKDKCENTGRIYTGLNKNQNAFNDLPYWFIYETFKESSLRNYTGTFALRFRQALVAFILDKRNTAAAEDREGILNVL
mgnify:CR=1 FL=1